MIYDFMIKTLVVANCTSYWNLSYPSSHTRLRQLADFPSLKVR